MSNSQNIYTFTYQKTLLHTLLLLPFKIVKSFQCILKLLEASCYHSSIPTNYFCNRFFIGID